MESRRTGRPSLMPVVSSKTFAERITTGGRRDTEKHERRR